jgi:hypothetical protein
MQLTLLYVLVFICESMCEFATFNVLSLKSPAQVQTVTGWLIASWFKTHLCRLECVINLLSTNRRFFVPGYMTFHGDIFWNGTRELPLSHVFRHSSQTKLRVVNITSTSSLRTRFTISVEIPRNALTPFWNTRQRLSYDIKCILRYYGKS